MNNVNDQDLPCLACCTRGCTDIIDETGEVELVISCPDCGGTGYLTVAQAEEQRDASRVLA